MFQNLWSGFTTEGRKGSLCYEIFSHTLRSAYKSLLLSSPAALVHGHDLSPALSCPVAVYTSERTAGARSQQQELGRKHVWGEPRRPARSRKLLLCAAPGLCIAAGQCGSQLSHSRISTLSRRKSEILWHCTHEGGLTL